jgi:hypothetical protein
VIVEQLTNFAEMLPVLVLVWLTWSFLTQSLGWTDSTEEVAPTPRELYLTAFVWPLLFGGQGYMLVGAWRDPDSPWLIMSFFAIGTLVAFVHLALYLAAARKTEQ